MPSPFPLLTADDVHRLVGERCFAPGSPSRVGVELEWLAFDGSDRRRPAPFETMAVFRRVMKAAGVSIVTEPEVAGALR